MHCVVDEAGSRLDAHADLDERGVTFMSRGPARNTQYGPALRLLLRRIAQFQIPLEGVWVDSAKVQALPLAERMILTAGELDQSGETAFSLMSRRMAGVASERKKGGGNPTKQVRIQFARTLPLPDLQRLLGLSPEAATSTRPQRIPFDVLRDAATPQHLFNAIGKLLDPGFINPFGPSTDYDLITETGERLPPKAVFGIAASEGLGREVLPGNFSSGAATFQVLKNAGYSVVPKGEELGSAAIPTSNEDREWTEGKPKLVAHLARERGHGLAPAKKDQFMSQHGRLFCERCKIDPVETYGPDVGTACIEVHHAAVHVSDMGQGHRTKLEDLQCLCANCHRVVHREIKKRLSSGNGQLSGIVM